MTIRKKMIFALAPVFLGGLSILALFHIFFLKNSSLNKEGLSFYFILAFILYSALYFFINIFILDVLFIRPIRKLGNEISKLAKQGNIFKRIEMIVCDEVSMIAGEINFILERMEDFYREKDKNQLMYFSVFYNKSTIMLLIDLEKGFIVDANTAAVNFYGYNPDKLKEMKIGDINLHTDWEWIKDTCKSAGPEQKTRLLFQQKNKNGKIMDVEVFCNFLEVDEKKLLFWIVNDITEYKKAREALYESEEKIHKFIESSPDGIVLADEDGKIVEWNKGQEIISGIKKEEALDQFLWDIQFEATIEENKTPENYERLKQSMLMIFQTGFSPMLNHVMETKTLSGDKQKKVIQTVAFVIPTKKGYIACSINRDITSQKLLESQVKASLEEKEVLLKEIHHRVKNNLQVISSLLYLQSDYIKDQEALKVFQEMQSRVRSMAIIHEKLYQSKNLSNINFAEYISDLMKYLFESYRALSSDIRLSTELEEVYLNINIAVPCGLIINELAVNSLKYAFPNNKGELFIGFYKTSSDKVKLIVKDNGIGMNKNINNSDSFGLGLIRDLAMQLNGQIDINTENGTKTEIEFPITN
jgi:PAS domain S-box-containing protein